MFIGIVGSIGAGKSTLTEALAKHMDYTPYFEPVDDNPYLVDYYKDMKRWGFTMQMFLMAHRYQPHQEIVWSPVHQNGGGVVQDCLIYSDTVFAKMLNEDGIMDDRDYTTYISHFNAMRRFLQYPDVVVYLKVTAQQAHDRMISRSRDCESAVPIEYLRRLIEGYDLMVKEMSRYTVVVEIDWSTYQTTEYVADRVNEAVDNNQDFLKSIRKI